MKPLSLGAKVYIGCTSALGLVFLVLAMGRWQTQDITRFICFAVIAGLASRLKVSLPGITGTMSVNFLFILIGIITLTFSETLVMGCVAGLLQCFLNARQKPSWVQVLFNVSSLAIAITSSYALYHGLQSQPYLNLEVPLLLLAAASCYFVTNTLPVAVICGLTEQKPIRKIWKECYFWSFPYYLVGAAVAGLFSFLSDLIGWKTTLLVLPVIYWIYRSYHMYLERLEREKAHAQEMAGLHLRTIEALALAIDAKDHTTHDHLRRVQTYAVEIGKELGLSDPELEALRAAALLHDIGKLAVPENIISKPGRLTPEEFEKMKIHPVVGAEILERVKFPYPVVPIVRCHHEKWDGSGYPAGLRGDQIPLGARILGAVDCLDALSSDRQYRRALPLEDAMRHVVAAAGTSFDPRVIEVLHRRFPELEQMAQAQPFARGKLSTELKIAHGPAPAAGFENTSPTSSSTDGRLDFLASIAGARQEVQLLFEVTKDLGNSLSLHETLSLLDVRLKRIIPYDTIAIYVERERKLVSEYVNGENFRLFASLEIPWGEGLSGWVAANNRPVVNGNPSVEPGYLNDPTKFSTLRSALAVPVEGPNGLVGVLALYHKEKDAFSRDHLRVLQAISYKLALSIENALKYQQAERTATTDSLTGLPNARSLFLHLDSELARCKREQAPLAVLVCDLDGFKQVNDRFGHLEGNRVLQMVAKGLRDNCRSYDYVARMGGDEFVMVLPSQRPENLQNKLKALLEMVSRVGRQVCGDETLSLSVGEAFYPMHGSDAEQLLAEADRRMYQAKQQASVLRDRSRMLDLPVSSPAIH